MQLGDAILVPAGPYPCQATRDGRHIVDTGKELNWCRQCGAYLPHMDAFHQQFEAAKRTMRGLRDKEYKGLGNAVIDGVLKQLSQLAENLINGFGD